MAAWSPKIRHNRNIRIAMAAWSPKIRHNRNIRIAMAAWSPKIMQPVPLRFEHKKYCHLVYGSFDFVYYGKELLKDE